MRFQCSRCQNGELLEGEPIKSDELTRAQGRMFLVWCENPQCEVYKRKNLVQVFRYYEEKPLPEGG